jgi:hypothetical protein
MTPHPTPDTHHPEALSVWPMVAAAGLTLTLFGLVVATLAIGVLGIVTLLAGVVGWVAELVAGE